MNTKKRVVIVLFFVLALTATPAAAQSPTLVGAAIGASVGQQIGCRIGNCSYNKITVGGLIGTGVGAIIGREVGKKKKKKTEAELERSAAPDSLMFGVGDEIGCPTTDCGGTFATIGPAQRNPDLEPVLLLLARGVAGEQWLYNEENPDYEFRLVVTDYSSGWDTSSSQYSFGSYGRADSNVSARGRYLVSFIVRAKDGSLRPWHSATVLVALQIYKDGYMDYWIYGYGRQSSKAEALSNSREEALHVALWWMLTPKSERSQKPAAQAKQ